MKKRRFAAFGALLLACCLPLSSTFAASPKQFQDVPPSKYFAEAVYDLSERNIISGYPDGTFKPGNTITRGQAAAIIAKMIKLDTSNVKNPGFKDVPAANGYYKAIAAMTEAGIISGYGDGRYGPNDPIKRGQMASILVKAFDLPRYDGITNPFKDVEIYGYSSSHGDNILILYKLGIAGGTSPGKFSPNAFVTRGQAAKMLKATEELKPAMVTTKASDLGLDEITGLRADQSDNDLFEGAFLKEKKLPTGYSESKIQLIPLKEGKGKLVVLGTIANNEAYKKYYAHIKKVNNELKLTLEETEDFLPTAAKLSVFDGKMKETSSQSVQSISLSTMDGKKLTDNMKFEHDQYSHSVSIDIEQPGQYIANVLFANGEEVRYGIEAKTNRASFYYDIKVVKEQLSDLFDMGAEYNIGKHTIRTKDVEQIATVTREPGTNLFRANATGQKAGTISIDFEHNIVEKSCDDTECYSNNWVGISVIVEQIGSIVNVQIYPFNANY